MGFHGELVGLRSSGPIRVFRHSTSLGFTALSVQRASRTVIGRFTRRCRSFTFGPSPDPCRNLPDSRPGPRNGASARSRRSPRSIGGSPASRVAARRTSSRTRASSKPLHEIPWVCVFWSSQTTVTSLHSACRRSSTAFTSCNRSALIHCGRAVTPSQPTCGVVKRNTATVPRLLA